MMRIVLLLVLVHCILSLKFNHFNSKLLNKQTNDKEINIQAISNSAETDLLDPITLFPNTTWVWEKAPPKFSLSTLKDNQTATAAGWILNLIEFIHWASFPIGFYVCYYIYSNANGLAQLPALGNDVNRVFFLILGLFCQIFGGGISGNMMHEYEGWQVTPFRNIIKLSEDPIKASQQLDYIRIQKYNNAWLRSVAYQMLFTFQSLGLAFFSVASYGVNTYTTVLVVASTLIALIGPKRPRLNLKVFGQPVLPLSLSLTAVFAVNIIVNLFAAVHLLQPVLEKAWPILPFLGFIPKSIGAIILSVAGPLLIGLGGAYEGGIAESTFNQWNHFIAFVILTLGLIVEYFIYSLALGHLQ
uniref:Uncharacterized protein n=1 Tax=Chromulina nebulosa TaxID=96789 RepID=A0A7S0XDA8_9STRA|mmetsp:Transcript_3055/g.2713  ORF Transcript_3055/g.2713 Transcript_3055/m.2713 type:complete len:357 (+) Transcript_3055:8-1078(+)